MGGRIEVDNSRPYHAKTRRPCNPTELAWCGVEGIFTWEEGLKSIIHDRTTPKQDVHVIQQNCRGVEWEVGNQPVPISITPFGLPDRKWYRNIYMGGRIEVDNSRPYRAKTRRPCRMAWCGWKVGNQHVQYPSLHLDCRILNGTGIFTWEEGLKSIINDRTTLKQDVHVIQQNCRGVEWKVGNQHAPIVNFSRAIENHNPAIQGNSRYDPSLPPQEEAAPRGTLLFWLTSRKKKKEPTSPFQGFRGRLPSSRTRAIDQTQT
ncbi:hypothetical protein AVEN_26830-1 [Araneus ventricosus]|uniref:Uncharacterized protein n=1 Tax=Araneus ventricosus TaxID=182803 RepID=A0A4Y2KHM9_ARAVE|nr:hypothetical protein AVEN_26830-1 [Araneus ventricosus]